MNSPTASLEKIHCFDEKMLYQVLCANEMEKELLGKQKYELPY